jgi:hypothetical protein
MHPNSNGSPCENLGRIWLKLGKDMVVAEEENTHAFYRCSVKARRSCSDLFSKAILTSSK